MPPQELPKLSTLTQLLATPEVQFESMVKSAGIELPPGPQSTLLKIQTSIEAGKPPSPEALMPKAPKLEEILGKLPKLPKLEEMIPKAPAAAPPAPRIEEGIVF
jgi:hypothetical protein